jgi:HSP20 family protein
MVDFRSLVPWRDPAKSQSRGELAHPFASFRREMDRMFDDFFNGGRDLGAWTGWQAMPALDVRDAGEELIVEAELPGVSEDDIDVSVSRDMLTIRGEKRSEHEEKTSERNYTERRYGAFSRSVQLPFEVGDEKVDATFDKGVLKLRIKKPADAQRSVRKIELRRSV